MTETINNIADTEEAVIKPLYTFRRLSAQDVFPMATIIKKIGVKEFKAFIEDGGLDNIMAAVKGKADGEKALETVGISIVFELVDIIFSNLPKCENDIYQLLSQTSGLTVEQVKTLELSAFGEMIIDFIKKEEFKDFMKVVSRLFR